MGRTTDSRFAQAAEYVLAGTDGVSLGDVWGYFRGEVPERTLQRWLTRLCADRTLVKKGAHRFTRYFPAPPPPPAFVCPYAALPDRAPGCPFGQPARATLPVPAAAPTTSPKPVPITAPSPAPARPVPAERPTSAPIRDSVITDYIKQEVKRVVEGAWNRGDADFMMKERAMTYFPGSYDEAYPVIQRIFATLDALAEAQLPRYDLTPAHYRAWKRRWKPA